MGDMRRVTRGHGLFDTFLAKRRSRMANKLILQQQRNGRILDIGCGATPYFLMNTRFRKKFAIDAVPQSKAAKQIVHKRVNIEEERLPFRNNFFDVVTLLAVFEHIDKTKIIDVLKEIERVLRPQGRFIITTPCPWTGALLKTMAKVGLVSKEEIAEHKGAYSHRSLSLYLESVGFKKASIKGGYFEWFLNSWTYVDNDLHCNVKGS